MIDNREAALCDEKLIKDITEGFDLSKEKDIEEVFKKLQTGSFDFKSEVGRAFDDHIFELHEKVLRGEIKDTSKKDRNVKAKKSNKETNEEITKKYGNKLDDLVSLELKKQEIKRKILIIIASLVAVASLGYFGYYYFMNMRTTMDYGELSNLKGSEALGKAEFKKNNNKAFKLNKQEVVLPDILDEYKTLHAKNQKMIGWLKIKGTNIDYPVMQTSDNEYYLNHNFNQEKDNNGSLFLDCDCVVYPKSTNMIIYGHHMKSGNMFGNLQKYAKESYYKDHSTISFDTIYEKGTYEVMYVFYSKVYDNDDLVFKYYQFTEANSENEFNYYMEEMKKLSLYDTGVEAKFGDTLLTLSTCDHSQTDGRFAVVAKKVK